MISHLGAICVLSLIIVTGFVLLFFATKGQYSLLWGRRGGSCLV
jgi:Tfp pilus assembly protein PilW